MTTAEFIQYANDRPELCEKMSVCTAPEEVYAIAVAEGLTDSQEEFKEGMVAMKNSMEISDADLENVSAAGTTTGQVSEFVVAGVSTSVATALVAAAL